MSHILWLPWRPALKVDLPAIMTALKLEPAGALARCRGGNRPTFWRDQAMVDAVAQLRMEGFRQALRGSR